MKLHNRLHSFGVILYQGTLHSMAKKVQLTLLALLFLATTNFIKAQVVINEILPTGTVELKNIGSDTVNVSTYWLCDIPAYQQIQNSNIVCGNPNMAPGEILTIDDFNTIDGDDGEMGLYINSSFGSSSSIIDYVEWGSTGHGRSGVAVSAGIWSTGDFVPAFANNESLEYVGMGDTSANWSATASPTICAENSNANICTVDGGTISTTDNTVICVDGNPDPIDVTVENSSGPNGGWIITDDSNNILALPNSPPFDLDGAGAGICIIWYIRYDDGLIGKDVGNNISDLEGCFDLSNGITVIREIPDGGTVSLLDGSTTYANCAGNIVFDVTHTTTAPNLSYWYIITDDNDNILAFQNSVDGNTLDLSVAPPGECHVWGWSYRGLDDPIVGDNISTLTDDDCEDISDNFITVFREVPDGGTVTLLDGSTTYANCAGNIVFDVTHTTTAPNLSYWYIITDDNDNILAFQNSADGNTLDLSVAPPGECHVWGWNYRGLDDPIVGDNISTLTNDDCEDISDNFITVFREVPDGGTVTLLDGSTSYTNCAGNIIIDVTHTTTAPNLSYWYIITDDNDNILAFQNSADGNTLDLSAAPPGECHVWGWNYRGLDDPIVGDNISTLTDDDCEDISDNFITVIREMPDGEIVDGGTISTTDNTIICVDGNPDPIDVTVENSSGPNGGWIITDDNNNILALPNNPPFDLDGAGAGICIIWYIRYEDGLTGKDVGNNISDLEGCFDLSNGITVIREIPDGGMVSLLDGSTTYANCAGDIVFDVTHTTTAPNLSYWYIITDANDNILAFQNSADGNTLDLSVAPPGECHVWGWSYRGLDDPIVGDNISTLTDDDCEDISDNFITVFREVPDGGTVTLLDGSSTYANCAGNIVFDVTHTTTAPNLSYWYIITDANDNILAFQNSADGNTLDLSIAPPGECHVWGWNYRGLDDPIIGDNISTLTDDDCEDISDNFITVFREVPDGGTVSLLDGSTTYANCAGNIIFDVTHTTTAPNLSYWYIITDDNDNILAFQNSADGNTLDLSVAPPGECHVWGWNYRGLDDPIVGDNISTLMDDDCEDISDNFITVFREVPDGGTVTLLDGSTTYANCAGNIVFDVTHTTTASNLSYWYIITDANDNILAFQNSADGNTLDLSVAPPGECHVWGWNYRGLDDPIVGDNISTLTDDDCEDISDNFITVFREVPDGGTVSLLDGSTTYANCAGNIVFDVTHTTTAPNLSYWYIITDDNDNILAFQNSADGNTLDLSVAPPGECHVWGWNYRGLDDPIVGDNISTLTDDDCEDISDNFITVFREVPDGGTVTLLDGSTTYANCAGNIVFDVTHTTTAPNLSYWYIITDANDNILAFQNSADGNTLDLSVAPPGECHVWGWNYRGLDDPIVGENISTLTDDDCEDISDNFITVFREVPDGGTVSLLDGSTTYANCAGNIVFDVTHTTTAPNLSYWYIITDANDNILAFQNSADGNTLDLSVAPPGECHVWGWNYRGLDDPIVGDNISTLTDDDCEDISDNFITVFREVPDGGTVSLLDGSTTYANCAGNIIFDITHTTTAPNLSYWYIITDDNDNILAFQNSADGNTLDLSVAPPGECHVWGWNYRGLDDPIVGDNISTLTDDDCEDISDNFITVFREVPDGGLLDSDFGTEVAICIDETPDPITVSHTTSAPNLSYWYIITDDNDIILDFTTEAVIDLNGAGPGVCRIWGWNYRGLDDPIVGEPLSTLMDDDCESVSTNFIEVERLTEGGPCLTSTQDIDIVSQLTLFPNPTKDVLNVEYTDLETGNAELMIVDVNGRTIQLFNLNQSTGIEVINVSNLPAGFYWVQIRNAEGSSSKKFIITE